jgi:hypothetical protein
VEIMPDLVDGFGFGFGEVAGAVECVWKEGR